MISSSEKSPEMHGSLSTEYSLNEYGLSTTVPWYKVSMSSFKLYFIIIKRYPASLISGIIQILLFIVFFGLFSTAISFSSSNLIDDRSVFIFFLGGLLLLFFSDAALWSPLNSVTRDLYNGTLEAIYFNPSSRYGYFVGYILGASTFMLFLAYFPIFTFLIFYANLNLETIISIFGVAILAISVLIAFGVMIALMGILWKNITGIAGVLSILLQFLTGAFIPVTSLPQVVQYISYFLPFTWAFDLIRFYSFKGEWQTIFPIQLEWLILFLFMIIYLIIAKFLLKKVERHAKTNGLHLI